MKNYANHYSLRSRLLVWIIVPIIISMLLVLAFSYYFARHEIEEVYDAQLVHSAKVLLQLTEHEILEDEGFHLGIENPDLQHKYERNLGFRVWVGDELITKSPNTNGFDKFEARPGFSNHVVNAYDWRFFVFLDPVNKIKIEVSERYDIRYELIIELMVSLIVPILMFLPVILLIIWISVREVLKPVIKISADVDKRGSDDLSPIAKESMPQEIAPLLAALNRLFKRLEESFKREREFTDHAAHELRTPLAAMKTQTQVLMKKAKDMPECSDGLDNLQSSINRATHLVEQLLSLARFQHEELSHEKTDFSNLLDKCLADVSNRAAQKNINISVDIAQKCFVMAHADSISILLGNLLDNAIKYTPEGGMVSISLSKGGVFEVADTGPGLSDDDKTRVFERFVRVDKSGQSGSGLGLSIAQSIANAHNITINLLDNKPKGLRVHIEWKTIS